MSAVVYIILAVLVAIGIAALFTAVEDFPEVDSCGYDEIDEHEDLTR